MSSTVRCISEGTIVDNGQLICLYLIARQTYQLCLTMPRLKSLPTKLSPLVLSSSNIANRSVARLLQRELEKCLRLVTFLPMQDMDKHFGNWLLSASSIQIGIFNLRAGV